MYWECRYCDGGFFPKTVEGDRVCSSCGAEWEVEKILVEQDED
ncbi:hypothetical protein [Cytobacillus horneckiae]